MTEDSYSRESSKFAGGDKIVGLLEKAGEFHWMLTIAAVILFADCGLMLIVKKNLINLDWASFGWSEKIGPLAVAGLLFSILISTVVPFLEYVAASIVRLIYYQWLWNLFAIKDRWERRSNMVTYSELKEHADRKQSNYVLSKCKEWDAQWRKNQEENDKLGSTAFRTFLLLSTNIYLSSSSVPSAIFTLSPYVSDQAFSCSLTTAFAVLLGTACLSWCHETLPSRWIEYAPLYDEIKAAESERSRRMKGETY